MSRVRPNKKLKYIKINKKDYYYLIKKISFLTKNNKILTDENNNYKKINEELKNQLNNINRNTLKLESKKCYNDKCNEVGNWLVNNNLYCLNHFKVIEYHEQNNKIDKEVIEEDIYDEFLESNNNKNKSYEDEILESDLEDIEDELYEENNSISSGNDIEEYDDNSSITSNTSNYSTTTNSNNNKKQRKDYIKINNNEENLKVINRLKKNNLNLLKCKDDVNLLNDVIVNNRNTLKLFNDLYTKIKNNQINSDNIYEMYDKNKSRFLKNLEISFKICSNEKIINSNLVFPLYTFNSIKKTSIDSFIKLIEEMV
jgi:hypothetical protein